MSECQGVIGELFLDKNIDDKNQAFTILSEVLKKCLTIYDVENRGGHAIQVETDRSLILMVVRELADPRTKNEIAADAAVKDIEQNDIGWEWVSLESVKLDRIESFSSWSEEARSVLKELLTNGSPREPVVSQIAKGHVALCSMVYRPRAAQREAILKGEKISVLGDSNLVISTWGELLYESKRERKLKRRRASAMKPTDDN